MQKGDRYIRCNKHGVLLGTFIFVEGYKRYNILVSEGNKTVLKRMAKKSIDGEYYLDVDDNFYKFKKI